MVRLTGLTKSSSSSSRSSSSHIVWTKDEEGKKDYVIVESATLSFRRTDVVDVNACGLRSLLICMNDDD